MHAILPLVVSLAGALATAEVPCPAPVSPVLETAPKVARRFTLPLRVPKDQLFRLLQRELQERRMLKNFQVVTSKFTGGRVMLDQLEVRAGPRPGTIRLEARARLRFERRQLGVLWRGFKSRKKWFKKGDKDAAKVRLTCTVELRSVGEGALSAFLSDIRLKIKSRLHPVRGLTARFDLDPREFEWTPEGGLFDHLEVTSLRITGIERDALRLEATVARQLR